MRLIIFFLLINLISITSYSQLNCQYLNGCAQVRSGCSVGNLSYRSTPVTSCGLADITGQVLCPSDSGGEPVAEASCFIYLGSKVKPLSPPEPPREPKKICGSIINVDQQSLGEVVSLSGTDQRLYYFSDRVIGRKANFKFSLPLVDQAFANDIQSINVKAKWLDQEITQDFLNPSLDEVFNFEWDGKDLSGNFLEGSIVVNVTVVHEYKPGSDINVIPFEYNIKMGGWKAREVGLGGWTHSDHHFYDVNAQRLYTGDANSRPVKAKLLAYNEAQDSYADPLFTSIQGENFYAVPSRDYQEVYIFNLEGMHQETRSAITNGLLKRFTYDSSNRLSSIVDSYNNITQIYRNGEGLVEIVTPNNKKTIMSLNSQGWIESITNPKGDTHLMSYTNDGLMTSFQSPLGLVSTFEYDSEGVLVKDSNNSGFELIFNNISEVESSTFINKNINVVDSNNNTTNYSLSLNKTNGSVSNIITYPSQATTIETDVTGDTLTPATQFVDKDFSGERVSYGGYLRLADPSQIDYPIFYESSLGGTVESINVAPLNTEFDQTNVLNLVSEELSIRKGARFWSEAYSSEEKKYTLTTPLNRVSSYTINEFNQIKTSQLGSFLPVVYTYDEKGNLSSTSQGERLWTYAYNENNELISSTDPLEFTTFYQYDEGGNLSQITEKSKNTFLSYDANGNVDSIKAPGRKKEHRFIYTIFNVLKSYLIPSINGEPSEQVDYSYDLMNRITKIQRPNGEVIDYLYNPTTGLLESITSSIDGVYERTYMPSSEQLVEASNPQGISAQFKYSLGFLNESYHEFNSLLTQSLRAITETRISKLSLALNDEVKHEASYLYDNDDLLIKLGDLTLTRDETAGLITNLELDNTRTLLGYDSDYGQINKQEVYLKDPSGVETRVFKQIYPRDLLGRIRRVKETKDGVVKKRIFSFNKRGRLTRVKRDGDVIKYRYDGNGNRRKKIINDIVVAEGTYNKADQILTYGALSFEHDSFGNQTKKINTDLNIETELSYDSLGALEFVRINNANLETKDIISYVNDGLGRRIIRSKNGVFTNRYIYNEDIRIDGETNLDGTSYTHFIYGTKINVPDYMIRDGVKYKFVTDHVGSVRMVINSEDSSIAQEIEYDEFGVVLSDTNPGFQPFYFAGGLYDVDTKLTRFGARDYDAETGRWTNVDPIRFQGDSVNLYNYVNSDPINLIDVNGLFGLEVGIGGSGQAGSGGGVSKNLAITINTSTGEIQFGTTTTVQGQFGPGLFGGVGLNFSLTPGAQNLSDLGGGFTCTGGGAGTGPVGGGFQFNRGSNGSSLTLSSFGPSYGINGYVGAGNTSTNLKYKFNPFGR